jgi:prepilin signal peptidase PulO-like enzyme (type II secretory pathway)
MDWSIVFVGLPVLLLVLVALRVATLRRRLSWRQSLVGVALGALLSAVVAAAAAGGGAAAWQQGLLLALVGFVIGALVLALATHLQRWSAR